ncbi:MAG: HPP family protein [Desulfocucumaceae bacterium]
MEDALEQLSDKTQSKAEGRVKSYYCKMKGGRCSDLPGISWSDLLVSGAGSFIGLGFICLLSVYYSLPLLLPSFGASAVLLYAACHVPMAQPRNVIGGHIISALVGVSAYQLLGGAWWVIALGVTLAITAMTVTHTLHPPGGATAFMAIYNGQSFIFILTPVAVGVVFLVVVAMLVNNLSSQRKYPHYWF